MPSFDPTRMTRWKSMAAIMPLIIFIGSFGWYDFWGVHIVSLNTVMLDDMYGTNQASSSKPTIIDNNEIA